MNVWTDLAVVAILFALGNIVFGHFEERTPKWRRVMKLAMLLTSTALVGRQWGHAAAAALNAAAATAGLTAHFITLRRHGIDPWTAEPREKYYAQRGWTR